MKKIYKPFDGHTARGSIDFAEPAAISNQLTNASAQRNTWWRGWAGFWPKCVYMSYSRGNAKRNRRGACVFGGRIRCSNSISQGCCSGCLVVASRVRGKRCNMMKEKAHVHGLSVLLDNRRCFFTHISKGGEINGYRKFKGALGGRFIIFLQNLDKIGNVHMSMIKTGCDRFIVFFFFASCCRRNACLKK